MIKKILICSLLTLIFCSVTMATPRGGPKHGGEAFRAGGLAADEVINLAETTGGQGLLTISGTGVLTHFPIEGSRDFLTITEIHGGEDVEVLTLKEFSTQTAAIFTWEDNGGIEYGRFAAGGEIQADSGLTASYALISGHIGLGGAAVNVNDATSIVAASDNVVTGGGILKVGVLLKTLGGCLLTSAGEGLTGEGLAGEGLVGEGFNLDVPEGVVCKVLSV